eukprot:2078315-Alexandrium_andersonii.AAC.1
MPTVLVDLVEKGCWDRLLLTARADILQALASLNFPPPDWLSCIARNGLQGRHDLSRFLPVQPYRK